MNDKSSNDIQNDNVSLLLNKFDKLLKYLEQDNHNKDKLENIINELADISELGIEAGFPALIDIYELIKKSGHKVKASKDNEVLLAECLASILPNLYSYIINPESAPVKDELIVSLQELDSSYKNNKQITMLRDMLDIFHCNSMQEENCITEDKSRHVCNGNDDQIQKYVVNKKLPKEACEILEIMMSEYLAINHAIIEILELINNDNSELLNNKLDEIQLSLTYYSEAVLSNFNNSYRTLISRFR